MFALREREFWKRYYPGDRDEGWSEDEEEDEDDSKLELRWPFDERFEVALDVTAFSKELGLRDRASGAWHSLGWWDDARWHPFGLRWAELQALVAEWASAGVETRPPVPLLLLCCFVGFGVGDDGERGVATATVEAGFGELGFSAAEAQALTGVALAPVSEADYRWWRHPELGWVFCGKYPCYSIRNPEHADGAEGRFPFAELRRRFGG